MKKYRITDDLFELCPRLRVGGSPSVGTWLRNRVAEVPVSRKPLPHNLLLLLGVLYQFATRYLADEGIEPRPLSSHRIHQKLMPGWQRVPAARLTWVEARLNAIRPHPSLSVFIQSLPDHVVQQMMTWAPPVVLGADGEGDFLAIANVPTAMLARQRLTGLPARVRVLSARVGLRRPHDELFAGLAYVLQPLYAEHLRAIIAASDDPVLTRLLTGFSRASHFRIRG